MRSRGRRAVFFDRDGVLTEPVWNPATGQHESPHSVDDLRLCPDVAGPLRQLRERGFELYIVSNQPSYAKGKASLAALEAIAAAVEERFRDLGVTFRQAYYCFHHPAGVVPSHSAPRRCRKPEPYFLALAAERHGVDLGRSWMVGDRDSDVECGQRAGCRTILIAQHEARRYQGASHADHVAPDAAAATALILSATQADDNEPGPGG